MLKFHQIEHLHIELTTRCNARCPLCMRNYRGLDYNGGYPLTELSIADIQHICQPDLLRQLTMVLFNGNLGDFGLAKDAAEIVEYFVQQGVPRIVVSTNGSMRTPDWWARLALPGVRIGFALDGIDQATHSLYRQDTNWETVIANATAFIQAGGQAVWRFVPFDHNRDQEQACRALAKELGFAEFENIYDGRDNSPVYSRDGEFTHWIGADADALSRPPPPASAMLESHITWFNSKTIKNPKDTEPFNFVCEHLRQKEIYIAADGTVYPCCFLGYYPQTMHHPGNEQLKEMVMENNALEYSLEHCLKWFEQVETSWAKPNIASGRLFHCVENCGGRSNAPPPNTFLN